MKNKFLLILLSVFLLLFIPFLIFRVSKKAAPDKNATTPSITPYETPVIENSQTTDQLFTITATSPSQGEQNVPVNKAIAITVNKPISPTDIHFSLLPQTYYKTTTNGNVLSITPTYGFQPGITYSLVLTLPRSNGQASVLYQLVFTTTGPTATLAPDTTNPNIIKDDEAAEKISAPDTYLRNRTPYSTSDFSVTSDFVSTPKGHFQFTVTQLTSSGKSAFIGWVKSFGITDQQIQTLDVIYE